MHSIKVLRTFKFAEKGKEVVEYQQGETYKVSEECAKVAVEERWAEVVK